MTEKKSSAGLLGVYHKYGIDSTEFYKYSKGFFEYVIRRYNNQVYDEDIHHFCYLRVLESVKYGHTDPDGTYHPPYYDPKRVNLTTFIFSTIRNSVSSTRYRDRKKVDNFDVLEEVKEDESIDFDWYNTIDFDDACVQTIKSMGVEATDIPSTLQSFPVSNPVIKSILWQSSKLNFLSAVTR